MAKGNIEVTVSIEKLIHEALGKAFNQWNAEYGVLVESVDIEWNLAIDRKSSEVTNVRIVTSGI